MAEKKRERIARFNLTTSQDTYSSQDSQSPTSSRRLLSLIPSANGMLTRELPQPKYLPTQLPATAGSLFEYAYNNGAGAAQFKFFVATATKLYMETAGAWVEVTAVGTLGDYPQFCIINNLLHMADGTSSWIYDGPNAAWVKEGFDIPLWAPGIDTTLTPGASTIAAAPGGAVRLSNVVTITTTASHGLFSGKQVVIAGVTDATFNGTFEITVTGTTTFTYPQIAANGTSGAGTAVISTFSVITNRYYWHTFGDETDGRAHESSSSPISAGTGALVNKTVVVYQTTGTVTTTSGLTAVTGTSTALTSGMAGMKIYIDGSDYGLISSVDVVNQTLVLAVAAAATLATKHFVVAPTRATHWHVYASESENSKVGYYLATVPINGGYFVDQSPFLGGTGSGGNTQQFTQINRPVRNDPPPGSRVLEIHKYRIWRRRETKPNFFLYTANEEVEAGNNGSPQESTPGADVNTLSDLVNESSYPQQSNRIRAMRSHGDALYIGSENNVLPLFGDSFDDFAISQVTAFSVGAAGRWAMISTPHGLAFMSYDRKMYLYPTSNYPWAYVPKDVNVTEQLIEIGKPMREVFKGIKASDVDNVRLCFYTFGPRNWLVVAFQDSTSVYQTWAYDFETKSWFQLQRGFSSLAVFEPSPGNRVLVGGGTDGYVYVIDDQTGTYSTTGTLPAALWRPALIDFGDPASNHIPQYIEIEFSNTSLPSSLTLNYYLDPPDADAPGTAKKIQMARVKHQNNYLYRGWFKGGVLCNRLLLEFNFAADANSGSLRSVELTAVKASGLI